LIPAAAPRTIGSMAPRNPPWDPYVSRGGQRADRMRERAESVRYVPPGEPRPPLRERLRKLFRRST